MSHLEKKIYILINKDMTLRKRQTNIGCYMFLLGTVHCYMHTAHKVGSLYDTMYWYLHYWRTLGTDYYMYHKTFKSSIVLDRCVAIHRAQIQINLRHQICILRFILQGKELVYPQLLKVSGTILLYNKRYM